MTSNGIGAASPVKRSNCKLLMRNYVPPQIFPDTTEHRADIQGIRALAVLSVIFYHGGMAGFPGGFVGVDVFFVISGFLITRLLMRELETTGSINVFMFWGRRVRRLLPNASITLLAVLAATAIFEPRRSRRFRYSRLGQQEPGRSWPHCRKRRRTEAQRSRLRRPI